MVPDYPFKPTAAMLFSATDGAYDTQIPSPSAAMRYCPGNENYLERTSLPEKNQAKSSEENI